MSIPEETQFMIRHQIQEGVPKARVARQLGVSRQSVYNSLKAAIPRKPSGKKGKSILDPYKIYIQSRLEKYDLTSTQVFAEIKEQGYSGGKTLVKDYLREVKQNHLKKLTQRFETVPGKQAQVDWGECGSLEEGGKRKKLYVFTYVLGYSRMMYARFTTSMNQAVLLQCLQGAFEQLGVPKEILFDNMKTVVDSHAMGEEAVFNRQFLDFAGHYGFMPLAAPPYWPKVKGKVESGVKYLKRSFLEGREFETLPDLNDQLVSWIGGTASVRVHGTTHQRPIDRYQGEASHLRRMEGIPHYDTRPVEIRQVASDSHIDFEGVRYSVHPKAVEKSVEVKAVSPEIGAQLCMYLGLEIVGIHSRHPKGSMAVTLAEHAQLIREMSARGSQARKRQPRFEQVPCKGTEELASDWAYRLPPVEMPPLSQYDQMLEVTP